MPLSVKEHTVNYLKQAYARNYDVYPVDDAAGLCARCEFHLRESRYVLVKRAELWAAEKHDYLYLYAPDRLNIEQAQQIMDEVLADGLPRVQPHGQHMCTFLTAVVLCDTMDKQIRLQLKRMKKHINYKLSFHGYMEFRIAAVELSTAAVCSNRAGGQLRKNLADMMKHCMATYQ